MSDEEVIEVTVDLNELKKLKVAELKRKLAELGLDNKGTKAELIARVEKYLTEQEEVDEELLEEEEGEEGSEEIIDELVGSEVSNGGAETKTKTPTTTDAKPPVSTGTEEGQSQGQQGEGVAKKEDKPLDTATTGKAESESAVLAKEGGAVGGAALPTSSEEKETTSTSATKVSLSGLSVAERLARRAARFGENTSIEAKKLARAERFGTTLENGAYKGLGKRQLTDEEMDRLKRRGERFGTSVSPAVAKVEDEERKKKRIEKFGLSTTELSEEERKKKRAEKFGT